MKWTSTAGPRQTKKAHQAIRAMNEEHNTFVELLGVIGGDQSRHDIYSPFGVDTRPDVAAAQKQIGERFAWTVTAENHAAIVDAVNLALPALVAARPVHDLRRTPAQESASQTQLAQAEAARAAAELTAATARAEATTKIRTEAAAWGADFSGKKSNHAKGAANLKRELEHTFPGVKFTCKSDCFSGGDSIDVRWELGPTGDEVRKISDGYQEGTFDGMTDSYNYNSSAWQRAHNELLGGAKYVGEHRETGDFDKQIAPDYCRLFGIEFIGINETRVSGDSEWLSMALGRLIGETSFPAGATYAGLECEDGKVKIKFNLPASSVTPTRSATPTAPPAASGEAVTFTENRAKNGVELRFPSKPAAEVLDSLKSNGWRWSRFSSCWYHRDEPAAREFALAFLQGGTGYQPVASGNLPDATPARSNKIIAIAPSARFSPAAALAAQTAESEIPAIVPVNFTPPPPVARPVASWKSRLLISR